LGVAGAADKEGREGVAEGGGRALKRGSCEEKTDSKLATL